MDLNEIASAVDDHNRGSEFELTDPVTGQGTGIKFRVAGPDSGIQRRAELKMVDELAEMAGPDGRVSAENRERCRIASLARCVLGWTIEEDGNPLPFNHANVVRVLRMARWVENQVDAFAGDRAAHRGER